MAWRFVNEIGYNLGGTSDITPLRPLPPRIPCSTSDLIRGSCHITCSASKAPPTVTLAPVEPVPKPDRASTLNAITGLAIPASCSAATRMSGLAPREDGEDDGGGCIVPSAVLHAEGPPPGRRVGERVLWMVRRSRFRRIYTGRGGTCQQGASGLERVFALESLLEHSA